MPNFLYVCIAKPKAAPFPLGQNKTTSGAFIYLKAFLFQIFTYICNAEFLLKGCKSRQFLFFIVYYQFLETCHFWRVFSCGNKFCLTLTKQILKFLNMSAKNILTNSERLALISEYEKDKLNSPPPNIKDETLIKNYGSDEQKARLQPTPAAETQKAAEKQTTTNNATDGAEAGEIYQTVEESAEPIQPTGPADTISNVAEIKTVTNNSDWVNEYNRYTELFKAMPDQNLTAEELKSANDQKEIDIEAEKAQAAQIKANLKAQKNDSNDKVTLQHNQTKEKIRVSRFTYENHMTQMTEWSLTPEVPEEVAGLEGKIKPPKESLGGGK